MNATLPDRNLYRGKNQELKNPSPQLDCWTVFPYLFPDLLMKQRCANSFMHIISLGNLGMQMVLECVTHGGFSCYIQKSHQGSAQHPVYVLQIERSPKQQKLAPCQFFYAVGIRDCFSLHEIVLEVSLSSSF